MFRRALTLVAPVAVAMVAATGCMPEEVATWQSGTRGAVTQARSVPDQGPVLYRDFHVRMLCYPDAGGPGRWESGPWKGIETMGAAPDGYYYATGACSSGWTIYAAVFERR